MSTHPDEPFRQAIERHHEALSASARAADPIASRIVRAIAGALRPGRRPRPLRPLPARS